MHRDNKGRHAPAQSKIAKMLRGATSPKERGGPARKPGNPGPNGNGKEKKVGKIEAVRARQPRMGEEEWEDVEKSGGYRKALARGLKQTDKVRQAARKQNKGKGWMSGYKTWKD